MGVVEAREGQTAAMLVVAGGTFGGLRLRAVEECLAWVMRAGVVALCTGRVRRCPLGRVGRQQPSGGWERGRVAGTAVVRKERVRDGERASLKRDTAAGQGDGRG